MPEAKERPRLGTFGGVFTPSILTILGVILYLRLGWVVGNVGLVGTIAIVSLATAITLITGLSVSAIATDRAVRTGGAYYIVSRSIGLESGGAVGIPLFFALSLSLALYTVGFAESVVDAFPIFEERTVAIVATVSAAILALTSARIAIRAQYVIMAAIGLSLLSVVFGQPVEPSPAEASVGSAGGSEPFWRVFAVYFPAVTGIMAGVNLSGDLKNPGRSLPRGTLAAIGVGYAIYVGLAVWLASSAGAETLRSDTMVMRRIAVWGDAVLLGVWGGTLSSAVGSVLGAPRVLQALARDGVLPRPFRIFARGSGSDDTPRWGTAASLAVALTAVALGNLDLIANVLTMFFLVTYAAINLSAGIEDLLGGPAYRPRFRVHGGISILGAVGCVAVMVLIEPVSSAVAAVAVLSIFLWLQRREMRRVFGDVRRGMWMAVLRVALRRLTRTKPDAKSWRPHVLVLLGAPTRRFHLVSLAASLTHNRSLLTVAVVLSGEDDTFERQASLEGTIRDYLHRQGIESMVRVVSAPDALTGVERLVGGYGLGPLVPNTIVLGESSDPSRRDDFAETIRSFHDARRNVVVVHHDPDRELGARRRIDVWWGGLKRNGGLMLTLAYLMRTSDAWRGAEVRLYMVARDGESAERARENVGRVVEATRTGASSHVVVAEGRPFDGILREHSRDADLVMLGLAEPEDDFAAYLRSVQRRIEGLPTTVLVLAAETDAFEEVLLEPPAATERSGGKG